jgi:mono/diheme cytochrome c family protein
MIRLRTALAGVALTMMSVVVLARMGMMHGHGMMQMSRLRHHYARHYGIDPKYASMVNPLRATTENLAAGKRLYEQSCAMCHGVSGLGDGVAGRTLDPPPSNLTMAVRWRFASDAYLYWAIADGGAPIGTAMPPFKDVLNPEQIWKLITYLRSF